MSIFTVSNHISGVSDYLPKIRLSTPKEMSGKLQMIAIPTIAFIAVSVTPKVQAIGYVECINNCNEHRDAHPLAKLICYTLCAIFSKDNEERTNA